MTSYDPRVRQPSEGDSRTQGILSQISGPDRDALGELFRIIFFQGGGHTLFGEKPLSHISVNEISSDEQAVRAGIEAWRRNAFLFPAERISIVTVMGEEFAEVWVVDRRACMDVVSKKTHRETCLQWKRSLLPTENFLLLNDCKKKLKLPISSLRPTAAHITF